MNYDPAQNSHPIGQIHDVRRLERFVLISSAAVDVDDVTITAGDTLRASIPDRGVITIHARPSVE